MRPRTALLAFLAILVACSGAQKEHRLRATLVTIETAKQVFVQWDREQQARIVLQATSREDGKERLARHRASRETVLVAFETAAFAVALASVEPSDDHEQRLTLALYTLRTAVRALGLAWPTDPVDAGVPDAT